MRVRSASLSSKRTRIAEELHDTLLQGFLSASMQLHLVVDRLPENAPERGSLAGVLALIRRVIDEGRNAVRGLRAAQPAVDDLERAFSLIRDEVGVNEQIAFRVIGEGQPQPLHPMIRDEVYRLSLIHI